MDRTVILDEPPAKREKAWPVLERRKRGKNLDDRLCSQPVHQNRLKCRDLGAFPALRHRVPPFYQGVYLVSRRLRYRREPLALANPDNTSRLRLQKDGKGLRSSQIPVSLATLNKRRHPVTHWRSIKIVTSAISNPNFWM